MNPDFPIKLQFKPNIFIVGKLYLLTAFSLVTRTSESLQDEIAVN